MARYQKNYKDVEYYVPGRKRRVAGSTAATSQFLAIVHEENPTATVAELLSIITDRSQYLRNPEAVAVLEAHTAAGYGNYVPAWRY